MLRPGQSIVLCVLALLTLGVVMVNSAGMSVDSARAVTLTSVFFNRTTAYMALALTALFITANLPVARLANSRLTESSRAHAEEPRNLLHALASLWPMWIAVGGMVFVLALVYLPGLGREVNKSERWIGVVLPGLGEVRAQPSEIAKWGLVALIAWYGWRFAPRLSSFWKGLLPALAAVGIVSAAIAKEDLGTGVLVASAAAVVLLAAGARLWHMLALAPLGIAGIASLIWVSPYRWERLTAFWNPYADPRDTGYHMIQSMAAVSSGEVFGRGLGHGLNKFGYLPEDTTDFLFAVICEELGVVGALLVGFLYFGLLAAFVSVIRRERHQALKLLAVGIMATIGIQAAINLFVVTGLGPTKGIALPLLSSGGTGWILTAASIGLIVAMDRAHAAEDAAGFDPDRYSEPRALSPVVVPAVMAAAMTTMPAAANGTALADGAPTEAVPADEREEGPASEADDEPAEAAAASAPGESGSEDGGEERGEPVAARPASRADSDPAASTLFAPQAPLAIVVSDSARNWPASLTRPGNPAPAADEQTVADEAADQLTASDDEPGPTDDDGTSDADADPESETEPSPPHAADRP